MIQGMIGKKLGMTQLFDESGLAYPVTVLEVGPCVVTQVKTAESDGYASVQLGFGLDKRLNSPERGHRRKSGFMSRALREVKVTDPSEFTVGQVITADAFTEGELVDVTGTSKGRGFQGGVKRHGFRGGPRLTGSRIDIERRVRLVRARRPGVSSRACEWPAAWATTGSRFRT